MCQTVCLPFNGSLCPSSPKKSPYRVQLWNTFCAILAYLQLQRRLLTVLLRDAPVSINSKNHESEDLLLQLHFFLTWGENHQHILHLVVTQTELLPVKYISQKVRTKYVRICIMRFNHWNVFKTRISRDQRKYSRKRLKKLFSSKPSFISTQYKISVLTFPSKTSSIKKKKTVILIEINL